MTLKPAPPGPRRRRRSSASSGWSYARVDWDEHAAAAQTTPGSSRSSSPAPSPPSAPPCQPPLLRLPADILLQVVPHLPYPALVSLRLAHPRFYHSPLLYPARAPAIRLRVAWLQARRAKGLPALSLNLRLDRDAVFLHHPQIAAMLRRELRHADCRPDAACQVAGLEGAACAGPRPRRRGRFWGRRDGAEAGAWAGLREAADLVRDAWLELREGSRAGGPWAAAVRGEGARATAVLAALALAAVLAGALAALAALVRAVGLAWLLGGGRWEAWNVLGAAAAAAAFVVGLGGGVRARR